MRPPSPGHGFIGRDAELAELRARLAEPETRLVTITGTAGSGKTRLARALAAELGPVVWVDLADRDHAEVLPEAALSAAGGTLKPGEDPLDSLVSLLAGEPCWIVLDNFEHLVDGGAEVVVELLRRLPLATCLVTSRRRLGCDGESEFGLLGLAVPGPSADRDAVAASPSAILLLERAAAAGAALMLTDANAPAVAAICDLLSGLPLALELAAASAGELSAEDLLDRLRLGHEPAATDDPARGPRHRSLQRAIDWSVDQLDSEARAFFGRLSVFRGGFSLDAAEIVCAEPLAVDHLAELVDRSLALVEDTPDGLRYRLLEVLRAYAQQRLAAGGDGPATCLRHFEYFEALAREVQDVLEQAGEDAEELRRLAVEHDNLRAALAWVLDEQPSKALELAGLLWRYWLVRGHWAEARETLAKGLERDAEGDPALRVRALGWAGHLALRQGDYARGQALLAEALELSRRLGDRRSEGTALNELGKLAWAQGDYDAAQQLYEASLALRRELGLHWGVAATLSNVGAVLAARGDHAGARLRLEEAHRLRLEIGDTRGVAGSLNSLGAVAFRQGDYGEAAERFSASLAIRRELDDRAGIAAALNDLGAVCQAQGDLPSAVACYEESLELREAVGDRRGAALTVGNLAVIAKDLGDFDQARSGFERSLAMHRTIGNRQGEALALTNLGELAWTLEQYDEAAAIYDQALAIQRAIGDTPGLALTLVNLADVRRSQGHTEQASALYHEALALTEATGDRWLAAYAHEGLGALARAGGDLVEARRRCAESLAQRDSLGDQRGILASLESLALVAWERGDPAAAALLLSASSELRQRLGVPRSPADERAFVRLTGELAGHQDQSGIADAQQRGRRLDWHTAVAAALAAE